MKIKKFLPVITTAVLSVLLVIYAFFTVNFPEVKKPLSLFEKLGIYSYGSDYGIINNTFSSNGTHEAFVSTLKTTADNFVFSGVLPFVILAVLFITALVIISAVSMKTEYKWTAYLCAVLLPIMFCDFTNLAFFKTLFINPLIIVLLLMICAVFLVFYYRKSVGIPGIITIFIVTLLYCCLGVVQAFTAIILGLLITRLYKLCRNKLSKIIAIVLGVIVILQSFFVIFTYKPVDYKQNIYNAVFFGVAKYDSVAKLGLDPKLDDFKEVYYGMKENVEEYDLENTFYNKISYTDIAKYYITHPVNACKVINYQASLSSMHEFDFGFSPYNFVKTRIPLNLLIVLVITIAYILITNILGKKYSNLKAVGEFFAGTSVMWLISLIIGSLYYGNCDMAMNMINFNILYDIVLLSALIAGIRVIMHRQDEKKEEFGITHE